MSKMSNLNLHIQDFAKDDLELAGAITKQLTEYLNGIRAEHSLSYEARYVLQTHDADENAEISYNSHPFCLSALPLVRISALILICVLFTTQAMAYSHSHHRSTHYHHSSIKPPKSWGY